MLAVEVFEILEEASNCLVHVPRKGKLFGTLRRKTRRLRVNKNLRMVKCSDWGFVYEITDKGRSWLLHHQLKQALIEANKDEI